MSGDLRITLIRSLSGRPERMRRIVRGLGLTRMHRSVTRKDTPEIRGMVDKVKFLLQVEIVGEPE
jgi:large subunit ribosomal protein L30